MNSDSICHVELEAFDRGDYIQLDDRDGGPCKLQVERTLTANGDRKIAWGWHICIGDTEIRICDDDANLLVRLLQGEAISATRMRAESPTAFADRMAKVEVGT